MRQFQLIVFILFASLSSLFAQQHYSALTKEILSIDTIEISPSSPLVLVKFIVYKDYNFDTYDFRYTRIEFSTIKDIIPFQIVTDTTLGIYDVDFVDINFDGYDDLRVDEPMTFSGVNTPCSFWLYNPLTKKFEFSPQFSDLSNVEINNSDSSFTSEGNWGGRHHSESSKYKIINGDPVVVEEESYDWGNYSQKELINGQMIETNRIIWEDKKDVDGEWFKFTTEEKLILGKLRPIEIVKKKPVDRPPPEIDYESYEASFDGRYIIITKETISYELKDQGKILKHSLTEERKDKKWIVIKETNEIVE